MNKLYIFSEDKKNVTEGQNQEKLSNSKWLQYSWDCRSGNVLWTVERCRSDVHQWFQLGCLGFTTRSPGPTAHQKT